MNVKKMIFTLAAAGLMLVGIACGGSSRPSAESLYNAFGDKYAAEIEEVGSAFGSEDSAETFEEYAASGDGCEPIADEDMGMLTLFFGPTLIEHGHSVVGFVNDAKALSAAMLAEGYCAS